MTTRRRPARWLLAHLIVTHRCNLACEHCYQAEHGADRGELTLEEWSRVMDELAVLGSLELIIGGGEPLGRRDFWDLLKAARDRRFSIKLFTNGTLIGEEQARRLKEAAVTEVAISLHHADKTAGDRFVRRAGAIDRINAAIDHLERAGVRTRVKAGVLADNAHDLPVLDKAFEGRSLVRLGFIDRLHGRDDGGQETRAMAATDAQLLSAARLAASKQDRDEVMRAFDEARRRRQAAVDGPTCGAGRSLLVVNPNGDVLPCNQTPGHVMGNVRQRPLGEIWGASPVRDRFAAIRRSDFERDAEAPCSACELKYVCSKCAALSFEESGKLTGYSREVCRSTKARWAALRERAESLGVESGL